MLSVAHDVRAPVRTPLLFENGVCLKIEGEQLSGSVKYRMVYAKVLDALNENKISGRTTLTEVTSGSTGVALAAIGQELGLPVELHVHETADPKKIFNMKNFGAIVIEHPVTRSVPEILGYVVKKSQQENYWHLAQMHRDSTVKAYQELAQEIVEQIQEIGLAGIKKFVCPVGTGGVIQGVGSYLRKAFDDIEIIAVEPASGVCIDGIRNTVEMNLGINDPYDSKFPNQRYEIFESTENTIVQEYQLGESASATLRLIELQGWKSCLMIAADA